MQDKESIQLPVPTPEQDDEVDRLVDQGFNYLQARRMAGVAAVEHEAALSSSVPEEEKPSDIAKTATPTPKESDRQKTTSSSYYIYKDGQRTINPNRLSSAELAKGGDYAVPKHVRDQLPYPR